MGACVSSPDSCVGGKLKYPKNKFVKRRRIRRRAPSRFSDVTSFDKADRQSTRPDRSFTNPAFHGLFFSLSVSLPLYVCISVYVDIFFLFSRFICGLNWNYGCGQMLLCHCSGVLIWLCERGWKGSLV